MNLYSIPPLIAGLFTLSVGLLTFLSNRRGEPNKAFFLVTITVFCWLVGYAIVYSAQNYNTALSWVRLLYIGVVFIPVTSFHTVVALTRRDQLRRLIPFFYGIGIIFAAMTRSDYFISGLYEFFWGFQTKVGLLHNLFLVFFFPTMGTVIYLLADSYRRIQSSAPLEATRIKYVLFSYCVSIVAAADFLPNYGLEFYPIGFIFIIVHAITTTYAIVRYRLMDINVAVTRTTVFMVVYAVLLGVPLVGALAWERQLERVLGARWWVWLWVIGAGLTTAAHYVNLYFQRRAELRLLREQRRYQETLRQASVGMTQIRELQRLLDMIVHVVTKAVGLSNAAIFLEEEDAFALKAFRYRNDANQPQIPKDSLLIELLKRAHEPVVYDELKAQLVGQASSNEHSLGHVSVLSQMHTLNASVIVPSFAQDRLIGFLVLGDKRNGQIFTTEDLVVFSTLANQAALAIENARFFEELKTNEAYMVQSEKMASLGQLASGMAHEIHNPLAIISGEAQLYLEQSKGKDVQVDRVLSSIIEECDRAAEITRRILRFARPGKAEFGPVDVRATIEESLQLVTYQVRLDRVERRLEIPANLPKALGNQTQLQEVFLNLILNACQAMGDVGGRIEIAAVARDDHVELTFNDTGPGIPHSKLSKIFDPFFTTKHNGTGLGLFVSQRIIRAHHGTIDVRSIEGRGTTFTIRLPIFRETPQAVAQS